MLAAPPDMLRINIKYVPQYYIAERHRGDRSRPTIRIDGLYLPPDDRRHYVGGTEITKEDFEKKDPILAEFWRGTRAAGSPTWWPICRVRPAAFDPKKPPEKTAAFWRMVDSGVASEVPELRDALDRLGKKDADGKPVKDKDGQPVPPDAVTLAMVLEALERPQQGVDGVEYFTGRTTEGLYTWLKEPKNRGAIKHRFDSLRLYAGAQSLAPMTASGCCRASG